MKIATISAELFNQLALAEPHSTIFQSTYYANYMLENGYHPLFLQALNEHDTCIGLTMLLLKKKSFISRKNIALCPNGYLVNFYDKEELIDFDTQLRQYLKQNENVDTLIIEPNIFLDDNASSLYLKHAFENIGYRKLEDIDYYEIETRKHKRIETNKNVSFDFVLVDNDSSIMEKYVDSENEYLKLFDTLKKHGRLFEIRLDSFRTKSSLRKNIDENNEYIRLYKDDLKFAKSVKEKTDENSFMNTLLAAIARYEKNLGDNPGLALCFVTDFSDQHLLQFVISRDQKDDLFEIDVVIINNLIERFKIEGIDRLGSFHQIPGGIKKQMLGRYSVNL